VNTRRTQSIRRRTERGATTVEFVIVATALLTLLFALIAFGQALYAYNLVSGAAREATRFAMVRGSTCSGWPSACPATAADVQSYVQGILSQEIYVNPNAGGPWSVNVNTSWPANNTGCTGASNSPGCVVQVQVQYNFTLRLAFIRKTTLNISSTSQMVISQ
jgi:Flp pilus assembly protein TadG